jgi:hypothetical protein
MIDYLRGGELDKESAHASSTDVRASLAAEGLATGRGAARIGRRCVPTLGFSDPDAHPHCRCDGSPKHDHADADGDVDSGAFGYATPQARHGDLDSDK